MPKAKDAADKWLASQKRKRNRPKRVIGDGTWVVPFGKHKGVPVRDLPQNYLSWCLREFEDGRTKRELQAEQNRRNNPSKRPTSAKNQPKPGARWFAGHNPIARQWEKECAGVTECPFEIGDELIAHPEFMDDKSELDSEFSRIVG